MGVHLLLNKTNVVVCLSADHTCVHVDVYHRFEGEIVGFDESGSPSRLGCTIEDIVEEWERIPIKQKGAKRIASPATSQTQ